MQENNLEKKTFEKKWREASTDYERCNTAETRWEKAEKS